MLDVLLDSLKDTALLVPFLLAVHLLIELFEVKKLGSLKKSGLLAGGWAPLIGTGAALLPQCGFSVVASELYSRKYIRAGTLLAVFVATSDEALPILLGSAATDPSVWPKLGMLIGIKTAMALAVGYAVNFALRRRAPVAEYDEEELPHEHGCCGHSIGEEEHGRDHGGDEKMRSCAAEVFRTYFKHPIIHTLVITAFVFAVNFVLGTIIFLAGGEEIFADFMSRGMWLQPLLAVVIGLIPNCASSVMITEMFVSGALVPGAAVAGLTVNAGLGLAVLFRENKDIRANLGITLGLVAYALAAGYIITAIGAAA